MEHGEHIFVWSRRRTVSSCRINILHSPDHYNRRMVYKQVWAGLECMPRLVPVSSTPDSSTLDWSTSQLLGYAHCTVAMRQCTTASEFQLRWSMACSVKALPSPSLALSVDIDLWVTRPALGRPSRLSLGLPRAEGPV